MSGMFWIALELSIPKIGFNIMLSSTVKKLDAFKLDGVVKSDNTARNVALLETSRMIRKRDKKKVQSGVPQL